MTTPSKRKRATPQKAGTYTSSSGPERYVVGHYENVGTNLIEITEDKLKYILLEYRQNLGLIVGWGTPVSILISSIATLCTATFKQTLGLEPKFWQAVFFLLIVASSIWLILIGFLLIKKRCLLTIKSVVEKIKIQEESDCTEE